MTLYHPPMERVLYNLHLRMCTFALRSSSHHSRSWIERTVLLISVCCFGALYMSHRAFVYRPTTASTTTRHVSSVPQAASFHSHAASPTSAAAAYKNIPLTCLTSIRGFTRHQADITHIILLDDALSITGEGISSSHAYTVQNNTLIHGVLLPESSSGACQAAKTTMAQQPSATSYSDNSNNPPDKVCQDPRYYRPSQDQIYFSYSQIKGYLLLPPALIHDRHDLAVQYVKVSPTDTQCFGEPFLQELVFRILSPETVIVNWLLGLEDKEAYAYHAPTDTLMDLHASTSPKKKKNERLVFFLQEQRMGYKLSVVLRTCFLFVITTTLVAFTLRETQERMLDFTQQLHNHVRHGQPVVHLVTRHLIDNLVFCPIMVGMIFFLIEFYHGDKALAFMVLSIVWLAEVFSVISLRSTNGLHFFPRIFFLLFSLFHFYLFSFPFGFTHTALVCTTCFMIHSMLFFWHRYELPAVALGRVSPEQPRMVMQQQRRQPPSTTTASGLDVPSSPPTSSWNHHQEIPPLRGEPPLPPTAETTITARPSHGRYAASHSHHANGTIHRNTATAYPSSTAVVHPHNSNAHVLGSGNSLSTMSGGGLAPPQRGVTASSSSSRLQQQHAALQRSHSHMSTSSHGGNNSHHSSSNGGVHNHPMSRQTSASALYWGDEADGDDSSSFHYFMGGEVVVPRQVSAGQGRPSPRPRIPEHVLASSSGTTHHDVTHTPIRDNLSAVRLMGPEHPRTRTAPALSPEWTS